MALDWSETGVQPESDEIELSLLGPGFGESVVIHAGDNRWIIVDSCRQRGSVVPAPLEYLKALGVECDKQVALIVATHWDQDHVGGIGEIVKRCSSAQFSCSKAFFGNDEVVGYLEIINLGSSDRGSRDFLQALQALKASGRSVLQAGPGRTLFPRESVPGVAGFRVVALSPSDREHDLFLREVVARTPNALEPMRVPIARRPNLASVVLAIDAADRSILLGADMEARTEMDRGWKAVVSEGKSAGVAKATALKVPHHGSESAHDDAMWQSLLVPFPIAALAPFSKGDARSRPPKSTDVKRLQSLTSKLFITAPHVSSKPLSREAAVTRSLRESSIELKAIRPSLGLVRLRAKPGCAWEAELFGAARLASE